MRIIFWSNNANHLPHYQSIILCITEYYLQKLLHASGQVSPANKTYTKTCTQRLHPFIVAECTWVQSHPNFTDCPYDCPGPHLPHPTRTATWHEVLNRQVRVMLSLRGDTDSVRHCSNCSCGLHGKNMYRLLYKQ